MARQKGKFSRDNPNNKQAEIVFTKENLTILDIVCNKKGISRNEYIDTLLNKEFSSIDKNKLADVMADLEKL